jgi:O-antigen/teichoic acid export membrane protein
LRDGNRLMSIVKNSFSVLQRDLFLLLTNLVTGIVIARVLGPEMLGLWAVLQLIPGYAEAFGRLKFDIAAVYFLGKKRASLSEMIFLLNAIALISSFVLIILVVWQFEWVYGKLFQSSSLDLRQLACTILVMIPLQFLFTNYSYLHLYREDFTVYNRMILIRALISPVVGIFLLLVLDLGLAAVLSGTILATFLSLLYGGIMMARVEPSRFSWNYGLLKDMAVYSFHLYIGGIIGHLQATSTILLTALYLPAAQIAFFSIAKGRAEMFCQKVPDALNAVLFPRVSKNEDQNESALLIARAFRIALLILIFTGLILMVLIKPAVYILYGEDFLPLVIPFWIIMPGLVLYQASSVVVQYFSGIGRADLLPKILFPAFVVQMILLYLLIQPFGIVGVSISFLLSNVILAIIQLYVFLKSTGLECKNLFPLREDYQTVRQLIIKQMTKVKIYVFNVFKTD